MGAAVTTDDMDVVQRVITRKRLLAGLATDGARLLPFFIAEEGITAAADVHHQHRRLLERRTFTRGSLVTTCFTGAATHWWIDGSRRRPRAF